LTYLERQKSYSPDKLCREKAEAEEAEAEEKIRLKQYVSLRSKRRHKIYILSLICFARMDLSEPHIEDIARDMRCDEMSI
jgi:hypothetical protein